MSPATVSFPRVTVGLDLGDRYSYFYRMDESSGVVEEGRLRTTPDALRDAFEGSAPMRIVIEVGTHSPWVSRVLEACGHEVLVANARKIRLIYSNDRKSDRIDAECLARLGRLDPQLLAPIRHRGAKAQADLAHIRSRDCLVRGRAQLINHVRGAVKSMGGRLPSASAPAFPKKVAEHIPPALRPALSSPLEMIEQLSHQIRVADRHIETLATQEYPETEYLRQVAGVGPITSPATC